MKDKAYIGREEAFEIMMQRGIETLPRKGKEWVTVHANATGKAEEYLGKDEHGYYVA
jgi:hypothetical protein